MPHAACKRAVCNWIQSRCNRIVRRAYFPLTSFSGSLVLLKFDFSLIEDQGVSRCEILDIEAARLGLEVFNYFEGDVGLCTALPRLMDGMVTSSGSQVQLEVLRTWEYSRCRKQPLFRCHVSATESCTARRMLWYGKESYVRSWGLCSTPPAWCK
jgi:hypothetical protein